jgi:hypothetical protein
MVILLMKFVRRKPMPGGQQAGVRSGSATQLGPRVELWKPAIS